MARGEHGAGRPDARAMRSRSRSSPASAPPAKQAISQPSAGLVEAVDVLGDVGQQRADQRVGREVHQEGEQHQRAHVGRRPDIGEALAAAPCSIERETCASPSDAQAPDPDIEREREARGVDGADRDIGDARAQQRRPGSRPSGAPTTRAESAVVRDTPMARIR